MKNTRTNSRFKNRTTRPTSGLKILIMMLAMCALILVITTCFALFTGHISAEQFQSIVLGFFQAIPSIINPPVA